MFQMLSSSLKTINTSGLLYQRLMISVNSYYQKFDAFERLGHLFSHVSETTFTFRSTPDKITYEHYLTIPKPMIEWRFNILLCRNPELVRIFKNSTHPLIRKYNCINNDEHDDEQQFLLINDGYKHNLRRYQYKL